MKTRIPAIGIVVTLIFGSMTPLVRAVGDHVVDPAELHQRLVEDQHRRLMNEARVREFLGHEAISKALTSMHIDLQRVDRAVSQLSDQELSQLWDHVETVAPDLAAGELSSTQLTIIVVVVALVLIIAIAA